MPVCNICKQENTSEHMTSNGYYCKSCYHNKYVLPRKSKPKISELEPKSYRGEILRNPGEWYSKEQEQDVALILTTIGWKYNKKNKQWYDDKIRDKDGNWLIDVQKRTKIRGYTGPGKYYNLIKEIGRIPFITYHAKEPFFNDNDIKDIQHKFFIEGLSAGYLTREYDCDPNEIQWVVSMTYKRLRAIQKKTDGKTNTRPNKSTT
jgi:hypothetical protein